MRSAFILLLLLVLRPLLPDIIFRSLLYYLLSTFIFISTVEHSRILRSSEYLIMQNQTKENQTKVPKGPNKSRKISHALSWALRHSAPSIGLTMTTAGWVPVQEIIKSRHSRLKGFALQEIKEAVSTSDKKRFALSMQPRADFEVSKAIKLDHDNSQQVLCIRANQGHSINTIDPNLLLNKLSPAALLELPCIVHGTYQEAWTNIQYKGLSRMNRTHIHFATGLPEDNGVISGMRQSCTVCIYVDAEQCISDGIEFFLSDNGVVLTSGVDGILSPDYFSRVTDSNGSDMCITSNS